MIDLTRLNEYRNCTEQVAEHYGDFGDSTCGVFELGSPIDKQPLVIVASSGGGWDHVSVSRKNRAPNQTEMDFVYRRFFAPDEVAVQFFVPAASHVNIHPNCLHLWRPNGETLSLPPIGFV